MSNNEKKTRADWLRDPKTNHPLNRPRSTWSESDVAWMEEEAKNQAAKIARASASRGTDKENTAELHRKTLEEMIKATPQPASTSGADDLFTYEAAQDEEEFRKLYNQARANERNNQPRL